MGIDQVAGQTAADATSTAGREFVIADRATGIASGNTAIDAVFGNPSGSGVKALLRVDIRPGALTEMDVGTDITVDTQGTRPTPQALNRVAPETDNVFMDVGGSYTVNGTTLNSLVPGGSGPSGGGSTLPSTVNWILGPGDSVRYTLTNSSGNSASFGIVGRWGEQTL